MLKSFAVAVAAVGVLATASPASAATTQASDDLWSPGSCPQGMLCVWPDWNSSATANLATGVNWSGQVAGLYYFNHSSRSVEVRWHWTHDPSWGPFTRCLDPGNWGDTYWYGTVTNVSFRTSACPPGS